MTLVYKTIELCSNAPRIYIYILLYYLEYTHISNDSIPTQHTACVLNRHRTCIMVMCMTTYTYLFLYTTNIFRSHFGSSVFLECHVFAASPRQWLPTTRSSISARPLPRRPMWIPLKKWWRFLCVLQLGFRGLGAPSTRPVAGHLGLSW